MPRTPDWVKHAIFYQIFPDRFARSRRLAHPNGLRFKAWGSPPEEQGFQGGDLLGIVDKLDYLQQLGVTALYLTPIFSSAANHRYHTYDYFEVDPLLGGNGALRELLDAAHGRKMRVVLDGVFNHASRGFWAFHHILENGPSSPYLDWFTVRDWPLRPYSSDRSHPCNYDAWWNLPALPKFNIRNRGVQDYLLEVTRHWLEFGIDGWRLDVPQEIKSPAFWRRFRKVAKQANPEAYLCGEIWKEAPAWLKGDRFDATMNYVFCWVGLSFFGASTLRQGYQRELLKLKPLDGAGFARVVGRMVEVYDWEVTQAQLNLLDSHDMARALWIVSDDESALRLAVLFQMTMPGAPCIYYGDEIGLSSGDDPLCRQAFPWHRPSSWNRDLLSFYRRATALRHQYPALRTGKFQALGWGKDWYAFRRTSGSSQVVVAFNVADNSQQVQVELPGRGRPALEQAWPENDGRYRFEGRYLKLEVPAREAVVLVSSSQNDGQGWSSHV